MGYLGKITCSFTWNNPIDLIPTFLTNIEFFYSQGKSKFLGGLFSWKLHWNWVDQCHFQRQFILISINEIYSNSNGKIKVPPRFSFHVISLSMFLFILNWVLSPDSHFSPSVILISSIKFRQKLCSTGGSGTYAVYQFAAALQKQRQTDEVTIKVLYTRKSDNYSI